MSDVDLSGCGKDGDGFYDVTTSALAAGGNLPSIKVDGPFGAPAEDVFKAEGAFFCLSFSALPSSLYKKKQD